MRREELFHMEPIGRYRRRGASPASKARRASAQSCEVSEWIEAPRHSSRFECDPLHCPPDCPILRAGNCPDSD